MKHFLLLLTFALAGSGLAGTEIVLKDGLVIQVTDLRREGEVYILETEPGNSITLPVSLVHEVRLVEDAEPKTTPEGWTRAKPQQLAGDPVKLVSPAESQKALGEAARFRPSIINPNWKPKSGFADKDVLADSRSEFRESIIDPSWKPESGFPDEDLLKESRSKFRESIIDSSWTPEDGFERKAAAWKPDEAVPAGGAHQSLTAARSLSDSEVPTRDALEWARTLQAGGWFRQPTVIGNNGVHLRFDATPSRPSTKAASVKECAAKVVRGPIAKRATPPVVARVDDARYAQLPIDLFASTAGSGEGAQRALFAVTDDRCRAISGDLSDALGVRLSGAHTRRQALASYNTALPDGIVFELSTDEAKIEYAFAVVSLVDPEVNGSTQASLLMVPDKRALRSLVDREAGSCKLSNSKRKKAAKQVRKLFESPQVLRDEQGERVRFFTWSSLDGRFERQTVEISEGGEVSIDHRQVAAHVGEHVDHAP